MRGVAVSHELTWRGRPRRDSTQIMLFCDCDACRCGTSTRLYVSFTVPGFVDLDDAVRLLGLGVTR